MSPIATLLGETAPPATLIEHGLDWLRAQLGSPVEPGFWIIPSLVLAVLATNLAWYARRRSRNALVERWPIGPVLTWLLVSLFYLLPPAAAWRAGAISPYYMGLSEIDWLAGLGIGGLLVVVISALALFGWAVYRHRLSLSISTRAGWWRAPLDAVLSQWHWTFYHAAAIGWLAAGATGLQAAGKASAALAGAQAAPVLPVLGNAGSLGLYFLGQPLYWGSWLGLVLAGLEWLLNPFERANLRAPGRIGRRGPQDRPGRDHDRPLCDYPELLALPGLPGNRRHGHCRLVAGSCSSLTTKTNDLRCRFSSFFANGFLFSANQNTKHDHNPKGAQRQQAQPA